MWFMNVFKKKNKNYDYINLSSNLNFGLFIKLIIKINKILRSLKISDCQKFKEYL